MRPYSPWIPVDSLEKIILKSNNYDELFIYLVPKKLRFFWIILQ